MPGERHWYHYQYRRQFEQHAIAMTAAGWRVATYRDAPDGSVDAEFEGPSPVVPQHDPISPIVSAPQQSVKRTGLFGNSLPRTEQRPVDWIVQDPAQLPVVYASIILAADETAHYEEGVSYVRVLARGERIVPGRMIVTGRRIVFVGGGATMDVAITKVLNAWPQQKPKDREGVVLELNRKTGSGLYLTPAPLHLASLVTLLARVANRQIVTAAPHASRVIPQDVKSKVWQRDGGRCVQCGSDQYLEYDHIIPWSKGGASSVENLQLLCRKCNALKGDRL